MYTPKGCFFYKDHKRIVQRDLDLNRLEPNGSCERTIRHSARVEAVRNFFTPFWKDPDYYRVFSTTCYEMCGREWRWSETDNTGLEWHFHTYKDADAFVRDNF
jgi:hypothetical protein